MRTLAKQLCIFIAIFAHTISANKSTAVMTPALDIFVSAATFQNELDKPKPEFGLGIGVKTWLFELDPWLFGAGARAHIDKQSFVGTDKVNVSPVGFYEETYAKIGYKFSGLRAAIVPYAGVKIEAGAEVFNRVSLDASSSDVALFAAFGGLMGMLYSIDNIGISLEYGLVAGLRPTRQSLSLGLNLTLN